MAEKPVIKNLASLQNESSAIKDINDNLNHIAASIEPLLSKDDSLQTTMNVPLDMNGNRLINLPAPVLATDPIRLQDRGILKGDTGPKGDKGDTGSLSSFTGTLSFTPTPGLNFGYNVAHTLTGFSNVGVNANLLNCFDSAVITGPNFLNFSTIQATCNSTSLQGGRQVGFDLLQWVSPGNPVNQNRNYVGRASAVYVYTGDNGKGLSGYTTNPDGSVGPGEAAGAFFGMNPVAVAVGYPFTGNVTLDSVTISNIQPPGIINSLQIGQFVRGMNGFQNRLDEATFIDSINVANNSVTINRPARVASGTNIPFGASKAQYLANLTAGEINVAAQAGSSVFYKSGIQICSLGSDAAQGSDNDAMISCSNQGGAIGWKDGLKFGPQNGQHPISVDGYLFRSFGVGRATVGISALGVITTSYLAGTGNRAVYTTPDGTLTNTASDGTLKKNIKSVDTSEALGQVLKMRPVTYKWRDSDFRGRQTELGFIAQEMKEIVPEVVGTNGDGTLSLDYPKLVATLVAAVQKLNEEVEKLKNSK